MKNIRKMISILLIILIALAFNINFSMAATTHDVASEDDLISAVQTATNGDVINLTANILLTKPLGITGKDITINGNGHTISRNVNNWTPEDANATLVTAGGVGTKLTLKNINFRNSQKYGVQSYDGAYVVLDGVTIADCLFGGVLVNAGTVEVKDLTLYKNGQSSNNGIEIAKGNGLYNSDNNPLLVMNGKISSTENDNVVYIAINDKLSEFEVQNTENTVNKIFPSDGKVVITDENNKIVYVSNTTDKAQIAGKVYRTVTVVVNEVNVEMAVEDGASISKEEVEAAIDVKSFGNYTLAGIYSDAEFKTNFDFATPITADTTIYAKLDPIPETPAPEPEPEPAKPTQDVSPKTGESVMLEVSVLVSVLSIISIVALKRKEF